MNLKFQRSSFIAEASHEGDRLVVKFNNGVRYEWRGVHEREAKALAMAPSPGVFFHQHIEKFHGKGKMLKP